MIQIKLIDCLSAKGLEKSVNDFLSSTTNIDVIQIHTEVNIFMYSARIVYAVKGRTCNIEYLKVINKNYQ